MPLFLTEISTFLVGAGLGLTDGTNLFKGLLPDQPDDVVVVYEYGGAPGNTGFGRPGIQDEMPGLQVVTRGQEWDYASPRNAIEGVYRALSTVQGTTLSGTKYRMIRAQQAPFLFNRDDHNRVLFAVNFLVEKELST